MTTHLAGNMTLDPKPCGRCVYSYMLDRDGERWHLLGCQHPDVVEKFRRIPSVADGKVPILMARGSTSPCGPISKLHSERKAI